jgi:hypothetical protein
MGIDFLDVAFRIEKQFGVRIEPADILPAWTKDDRNDVTAGEFHEIICEKCREQGIKVPRSSWNQLKLALVDALGVTPSEIKKDAWLRKDLDFV